MAGNDVGEMKFHSIQVYTSQMKTVEHYVAEGERYNTFMAKAETMDVAAGQALYEKVFAVAADPEGYTSVGQDLVQQLISGMGWRVIGQHETGTTRSLVVGSSDERGVRFIFSHVKDGKPAKKVKADTFDHFDSANINRFHETHSGREGVAVMAFELGTGVLAKVKANYAKMHAPLIKSENSYVKGDFKVMECYAFYHPEHPGKKADEGTVIRYIERNGNQAKALMPGFEAVKHEFGVKSPAFFDHWVSNVVDRLGFMKTLSETLGFTPKVDFNAGVVAAGEAQIESTVIGNTPAVSASFTVDDALVDQHQLYLPINNALSEVGHVHFYIKELGQGVQHIASRVPDLVELIGRTNKFRKMTGNGFTFLNIPRSYYGTLTVANIESAGVSAETANALYKRLLEKDLVSKTGITKIDMDIDCCNYHLKGLEGGDSAKVHKVILQSKFNNLIKLLGNNLSDETLLKIVENKILVDVQGNDVLYQIFTSCVLQQTDGDEAPFLEFIQRVCSDRKDSNGKALPLRPGCGGFGIRNFLTLFLSIEVSKAMRAMETAEHPDDVKLAEDQIKCYTQQLDESNPILTAISDAMTGEGDARHEGNDKLIEEWLAKKETAQKALEECSLKYKTRMHKLRSMRGPVA